MLLLVLLALPRAACEPEAGMVDGDTLHLDDGRRVRLPGIDAPESGRPFAAEAAAFASALLERAPFALVPPDAPADRYGRLLADVRVGDESLSAALVSAGLAWVGSEGDPGLVRIQAAAVESRRGMHALLDGLAGPFAVTKERFHRPDCPFLRQRTRELPLAALAAPLLASGRAPCRTCLPWPPRAGLPGLACASGRADASPRASR
jgi:hypothetical protein